MTDLMVDAGVAPRERFTTVYSGMDVEPFLCAPKRRDRERSELGYGPQNVVIGKIARLFHLKGHGDVIDAARRVTAEIPEARFLFVGDGVLQESLRRRIADAGLSRYFHFTGLVAPERVADLIAAMDIVVHTSLREGLARALPQALLVGRPVVSYDVYGARDVVIAGETGVLVRPGDVPGLAKALVELARDAARRAQFGAEGRRRFANVFRHENATRQIREIYKQLLAQGA